MSQNDSILLSEVKWTWKSRVKRKGTVAVKTIQQAFSTAGIRLLNIKALQQSDGCQIAFQWHEKTLTLLVVLTFKRIFRHFGRASISKELSSRDNSSPSLGSGGDCCSSLLCSCSPCSPYWPSPLWCPRCCNVVAELHMPAARTRGVKFVSRRILETKLLFLHWGKSNDLWLTSLALSPVYGGNNHYRNLPSQSVFRPTGRKQQNKNRKMEGFLVFLLYCSAVLFIRSWSALNDPTRVVRADNSQTISISNNKLIKPYL